MPEVDSVSTIVENMSLEELSEATYQLQKPFFETRPVGVRQFVEDPRYLGSYFSGSRSFYPFWMSLLEKIYPTEFHSPYHELIFNLPIGSGKCLQEDTRISTSIGLLRIKDLYARHKAGDRFTVLSEDGPRQVVGAVDNGVRDTKVINTRDGRRLEGTGEHRFRVLDECSVVWKRLKDVSVGDVLVVSGRLGEHSEERLPEGYAYLLGVLSGDGTIAKVARAGGRRWCYVCVCAGKDSRTTQPEYMDEVESLFRRYIRSTRSWEQGKSKLFVIQTSNSEFAEEVESYGFHDSEGLKRVPENIFSSSVSDQVEYFSGVVDTDGCIFHNIEVSTKSLGFARDLLSLVSSWGVRANLRVKHNKRYNKDYYKVTVVCRRSWVRLRELGLRLRVGYKWKAFCELNVEVNKNTRTVVPGSKEYAREVYRRIQGEGRKRIGKKDWNLFGSACTTKGQNITVETLDKIVAKFPECGDEFSKYVIEKQCWFDEVVSVEDSSSHTYDLSVEECHSYSVGGAISHNTISATTVLLYEIYKLQCLKDPNAYYSLAQGIPIVFSIFSASMSLATDVNWEYFEALLTSSPYFVESCPLPTKGKAKTSDSVSFPKNVVLSLGSVATHALGKAVIGGCFGGGTQVKLVGGGCDRIDRIADRVAAGEELWVHSYEISTGEVVPGRIERAFCSGVKHVFRVILREEGVVFDATGDHPILCSDGEYRPVGELLGRSLLSRGKSFPTRVVGVEYVGVSVVYDLTIDNDAHNFELACGVWAHNCLDEANFQRLKSEQAKEGYLTIKRRRESRFLGVGGMLPGKLLLMSSPKHTSDFLVDQIEAAKNSKKTLVVRDIPIWEVRKGSRKDVYCGRTFPVFVGSSTHDPFVLKDDGSDTLPESGQVVEVPVEYKDSFETDILSSLRDIYGKSISSAAAFITSPSKVVEVSTIPHRFTKEVVVLDFYDESDTVMKYMDRKYFKKIGFPELYRYIHCDLAYSKDRVALASVYALADKSVMDKDPEAKVRPDRSPVERYERSYYVDWILYVQAKDGQEIPLYKIRDFLLYLKKDGYPIFRVSADQFQSRDLLQQLEVQGFRTENISVDKTRYAYLTTRELIYRAKLLLPKHSLLRDEFCQLQDSGEKIDHLAQSSKDGSDAVAGAVFSCVTSNVLVKPGGLFAATTSTEKKVEGMLRQAGRQAEMERMARSMGVFPRQG